MKKGLTAILLTVLFSGLFILSGAGAEKSDVPLKVGVVNLPRVFREYVGANRSNDYLNSLQEAVQAKLNEMQKQAADMQAELDALTSDSKAAIEKAAQIREIEVRAQVFKERQRDRMQRELERRTVEIYREVTEASRRFAFSNGYQILLKYDESVSENSPWQQVMERIDMMSVVVFDPGLDVTEPLIRAMNASYKVPRN